MSADIGAAFEDVPERRSRGAGIPWFASVGVVVGLGLVATLVDWVLGDGPGLATGVGFALGCLVLGGRTRIEHIVVALVGAPLCYAAIVVGSGVVQLFGDAAFWAGLRVFWTYALVAGAPWLIGGTVASCALAGIRLARRRR